MEFKHLCNVCLAKQFVLKKRVLPVFWPLAYSLNYISELFIIMFHKYNKFHLINHFQETVLINLLYSSNNASHKIPLLISHTSKLLFHRKQKMGVSINRPMSVTKKIKGRFEERFIHLYFIILHLSLPKNLQTY